jgi:hypothetical protein
MMTRPRTVTKALFAACALAVGLAQTPARSEEPPAAGAARPKTSQDLSSTVMPCFETLADGSTRLYVELPKAVTYDAKTAHGSVTYVLKGVHVERRNNLNPLVTTYFNTPVTTAQFVPHGRDLWFVLDMRADVEPVVSMGSGNDGAVVMSIQFPKGDYLPAPPPEEPRIEPRDASAAAAPAAAPAPAASAPRAAPANRQRSGGHSRRRGLAGGTTPPGL